MWQWHQSISEYQVGELRSLIMMAEPIHGQAHRPRAHRHRAHRHRDHRRRQPIAAEPYTNESIPCRQNTWGGWYWAHRVLLPWKSYLFLCCTIWHHCCEGESLLHIAKYVESEPCWKRAAWIEFDDCFYLFFDLILMFDYIPLVLRKKKNGIVRIMWSNKNRCNQ